MQSRREQRAKRMRKATMLDSEVIVRKLRRADVQAFLRMNRDMIAIVASKLSDSDWIAGLNVGSVFPTRNAKPIWSSLWAMRSISH